MPALSLIMSICHPELYHFKNTATVYGCQHEKKMEGINKLERCQTLIKNLGCQKVVFLYLNVIPILEHLLMA